jgi:phage terminase large subunit
VNKVERLRVIVEELKRRKALQTPPSFLDPIFVKQNELIQDTSKLQAWNCTRRGAKSNSFARKVVKKLVENPGHKALYMALTLDSAKEILFDVVEELLESRNIGHKADRNKGIFRLDNGSQLRFFGVDASYKEMKKALGQKLSMVGIDEVGSMTIDMPMLVYNMIRPALMDLSGELIILGTCENIPNTFFEAVLTNKEQMSSLWKKHIWTTVENPYMADKFLAEIEEYKKANPLVVNSSWFRTHYLNQWCADDDLIIIRFNPEINHVDDLPKGDYYFGLGVDLGFNDASSFVVAAFSRHDANLYIVEAFKSREMDLTQVSNEIKRLDAKYGFFTVQIDGANKQGIEEMQNRHGHRIKLESAEKTDKATFLRLMSDDYKQGVIKHLRGKCSQLEDEQSKLMWIKDTDREDPRCENHCQDGALYIWRKSRNYLATQKPEPVDINSNKFMKDYAKKLAEIRRKQNED